MLPTFRSTGIARIALAVTVLLALTPSTARGQEATPELTGTLPDGVTIVANGLDNPRNFTWDAESTLYLALAGVGGPSMGDIGGSPSGLTGGPTASVVTLAGGCATVATEAYAMADAMLAARQPKKED